MDDDITQYTRVQILTKEMCEEEDDNLPEQYRKLDAPFQKGSTDSNPRMEGTWASVYGYRARV